MAEYSKDLISYFYRIMWRIRHFEQTVERFFLDGEIPGFVHLYIGEEAIATGVCANLTKTDYIESTHRGWSYIGKGADVNQAWLRSLVETGFVRAKAALTYCRFLV